MPKHPIIAQLKKAREERGMSQSALARRLYKTRQTIAHFENASGDRQLQSVEEIARVLGFRLVLVPIGEGKRNTRPAREAS